MNKIWKIVAACFVLPASFLCATSQEVQDEKQNDCFCVKTLSRYFDMEVEISNEGKSSLDLALLLGIGHRAQKDHHGLEVYGAIGSSGRKAITRLNVLYNYFFIPNPKKQLFVGLGLEARGVYKYKMSSLDVTVFPVLAIGQEFTKADSRKFVFQMQINALPEIIFSYGICF